ncbi:MAG TPA: MBL fold metallo-hydrolase [Anaerolineae bacterium]|nr:MBL fold metallo-hydrolase [Anaerolineae bacterium]
MFFKQIMAGGDRNFSYIVADELTGEAAVIDPGMGAEEILLCLGNNGLTLMYIINTHAHFDHTAGNTMLSRHTGAKIAVYTSATPRKDLGLSDGDELKLGSLNLRIIHTPGHTEDSICVLAGKELMTGDTLFVGKVGGTGYGKDARSEYESIHNKLMTLPPETRVWPGHDYGVRASSTIGDEKRENPFILRDSFESFVELKRNWLEYKKKHGIK